MSFSLRMGASGKGIGSKNSQAGITLVMTLIVMVALLLASVAMVRSVDTTGLIAGNMVFKKATLSIGDCGLENAYRWLRNTRTASATTLNSDGSGSTAFYRSSRPTLDSMDQMSTWTGTFYTVPSTAATDCPVTDGYTVSYIIHRMCATPNAAYDASGQVCGLYTPISSSNSNSGYSFSAGATNYGGDVQVYYRITCVVTGPRNTNSVIQSIVLIGA